MGTASGTEVSRRQALRRGAVAGTLIWSAPIVMSTTAHASKGSNGSATDGPCKSVTCCWNRHFWQPNRGTSLSPANDLSGDTFCEVEFGQGWKVIKFLDSFTVPAGFALKFRRLQLPGPGQSAVGTDSGPVDEPVATTTTTTTTVPEASTTSEPERSSEPEPAPTTPAADTINTAETTTSVQPAPVTTPAPVATPPTTVDTIVIDMSGRTDLNIGDVYGVFQIVDAEPA